MAELAPEVILPRVVKHSMVHLSKPAYFTVTMEEFAIMNTPEGEVYNTSLLQRLVYELNHGQKSWDTFAFLGRFPINTGHTPPLTPQAKLDACIQIFSIFNFKDALFYNGTQK